ncbi:autotransporter domain-containing protein [uncultured Desulfovibrio sp.]|uniref:autotransporter outer membrane beta-barrel domain-containing protein n=1 Tax=uncultured Desulfovibrio sp. TaxID=167968 RepID=UPI0025DA56F0|nr:autotransporter domain-containing protein [uncultured Desulfovibrio sp.]
MHMSQGSLGMLIKRYRAILKKCHMLNVLGGTLLAGALALGMPAGAQAETELADAAAWNTWLQTGQTVNGATNVKVQSSETLTMDVSDFVTTAPSAGQVKMEDYGRISINGTFVLEGNTLNLGTTQFAEGNPSGMEATLKASAMELRSPTNNFLLSTGKLYLTGDASAGNRDLKIGDGTGTLTLNGGSLRLGNSDPSPLVVGGTVQGSVVVGAAGPTINSEMKVASGDWNVTGDVSVEESGLLQVTGDMTEKMEPLFSSLTIEGTLQDNGGQILVGSNAQGGEGKITVNGGLTGNAQTDIKVGSSNGATSFTAANIQMNGGKIAFDPPFIAAGDTSNAALGGLSFAADTVDGLLTAGRNSMVSLGSTDAEWLRSEVIRYQNDGKGSWGQDITAALAIRTPQTLAATGGINVDGTWVHGGAPATANSATFADSSLLVVDAAGVGSGTALSGEAGGTSTLNVASGAKLHIVGGQGGQTVNVTANFGTASKDPAGWTDANLTTSTALLSATGGDFDTATGAYSVTLTSNAAASAFPALSGEMATLVDRMALTPGVDVQSSQGGVRFLSRALSDTHIGTTNSALAASTIEGAARMAVIGGVPQLTWAAHNAAGTAVSQRTSLAAPHGGLQSMGEDGKAVDNGKTGFAMWIMPLYQSWNGFGLEGGNFDMDMSGGLGGVAIGADYTFAEAIRAGITFNIGGGYAEGSGDFNKTTNNMNFWGIGAYVGWTPNAFSLTADLHYTSTFNDVEQELPSGMQMGDLKSDINAYALSAGLRGEYKLETSVLDIIPHVGVRYTSLNTYDYDVKSGGTILEGDALHQNIWTFPVGVAFSKDIETGNGWRFTPSLDLAVIPAAGDIKARGDVRFTGVDRTAEVETQTLDYITYMGQAGIEFGNDALSFGVNYNLQAGAHTTAHGVFGTFRYEF